MESEKISTNNLETNNLETTQDTSDQDFQNMLDSVFNKNNLIIASWFLGVYLVVYLGLGIFYNKNGSDFKNNVKKIIDFLFLILLVFMLITFFYLLSKDQQSETTSKIFNTIIKFLDSNYSLLPIIVILIGFYIFVYLFRIPMNEDKPFSVSFMEGLLWVTLVIIVLVQFFKQIFNLSLLDFLKEIEPKQEEKEDSCPVPLETEDPDGEVFHIGNNKYTYDDAQAICKSFGAKLASYKQIEEAYKKGGEWCGYGWSEDQMALFPTQQSTYDKLKDIDDEQGCKLKNNNKVQFNCGRPGINGGYISNPYIKFGVNCFGNKPEASETDLAQMNVVDQYPKNAYQKELDSKIQYWKDNAANMLNVSSFNKQQWNEDN